MRASLAIQDFYFDAPPNAVCKAHTGYNPSACRWSLLPATDRRWIAQNQIVMAAGKSHQEAMVRRAFCPRTYPAAGAAKPVRSVFS
jgi:hypothetical protein